MFGQEGDAALGSPPAQPVTHRVTLREARWLRHIGPLLVDVSQARRATTARLLLMMSSRA